MMNLKDPTAPSTATRVQKLARAMLKARNRPLGRLHAMNKTMGRMKSIGVNLHRAQPMISAHPHLSSCVGRHDAMLNALKGSEHMIYCTNKWLLMFLSPADRFIHTAGKESKG